MKQISKIIPKTSWNREYFLNIKTEQDAPLVLKKETRGLLQIISHQNLWGNWEMAELFSKRDLPIYFSELENDIQKQTFLRAYLSSSIEQTIELEKNVKNAQILNSYKERIFHLVLEDIITKGTDEPTYNVHLDPSSLMDDLLFFHNNARCSKADKRTLNNSNSLERFREHVQFLRDTQESKYAQHNKLRRTTIIRRKPRSMTCTAD